MPRNHCGLRHYWGLRVRGRQQRPLVERLLACLWRKMSGGCYVIEKGLPKLKCHVSAHGIRWRFQTFPAGRMKFPVFVSNLHFNVTPLPLMIIEISDIDFG